MEIIQNQLNPIENRFENILNGLIVYKNENDQNINIDETIKKLKIYEDMPIKAVINLVAPELQEINMNIESDETTTLITFTKDTLTLLYNILNNVVKETKDVYSLNIVTEWSRRLKYYCTIKARQLEDIKKTSERNLIDFMNEASNTSEDIMQIIILIKILISINTYLIYVIMYFLYKIINRENQIENDKIEYIQENETKEDKKLLKGGKRTKRHKIRKPKYKTKKYIKTKYKNKKSVKQKK